MTRLVLSFPMTGRPDFGFAQGDDARDRLVALGYDVTSPADMDRARGWVIERYDAEDIPPMDQRAALYRVDHTDRFDYETAMQACLDEIGASDGIVLLDGWDQSPGCLRELAEARRLGKRVYRLVGDALYEMGHGEVVSRQNVPAASVDWNGLRERLDHLMEETAPTPDRPEQSFIPTRAALLREAETLICGDRNNQYGPPTQDFERTAAIWTAMFGREFSAHEVALGLIAVKLSRIAWSEGKRDHWADLAGYAACGWECVEGE